FRHFDLLHLDRLEADSYDLVSMGWFLHGLSADFRRYVLRESARIARVQVLIFDYCCDGGWLVRLIEWIEGPNYPAFIAGRTPRAGIPQGSLADRSGGAGVGLRRLLALYTLGLGCSQIQGGVPQIR
ncbi:MAG: hypothetical protein GY802_10885, partial [Gammaproteobacteria bacterium]|nr:hypothetical protein [Gammaproteobacteria bacterium]